MEFQKQQITVHLQNKKDGTVFDRLVDATVGIGSGLAYHDRDNDGVYTLTHVASGYGIAPHLLGADTDQEAQRWLEIVAEIADWAQGKEEIIKALRGTPIRKQIEDALDQAVEEVAEHAPTPES